MSDDRAEQIIKMRNEEKSKRQNFDSLYQSVADLMYPLENQISQQRTTGEDKSLLVRDPTAIFALDDMVAGLIGTWIPSGRNFFGIKVKNRNIAMLDNVMRWCALATQIAHDELFSSNFLMQLHDTVKALGAFGTGCLYSEFVVQKDKPLELNFKDHHISTYTIKQNSKGIIDTVILELNFTARQAVTEYANAGEKVIEDAKKPENESKVYPFIHIVRPRNDRNYQFTDAKNMPFESIVVNEKEKIIVEEGGFFEFPFAVPRWEKSSCEKYGRGRGTVLLSAVKELQQMRKDFIECANRWNNPPREVVDNNVEGEVDNSPNALNHVTETGSIRALDQISLGSFPITKDTLEQQQDLIRKGFYNDIFVQMGQLTGDRRTTVEIEARLKEGLRRLVSPVVRLETELFTPLITRSILELIRNGRIPYPPAELSGQGFGVEYMGELAMAMRNYQARAFTQYMSLLSGLAPTFPDVADTINLDRALPNIAITYGMRVEDLATPEEINGKKQARAQQQQAMMQAQMLQAAGDTYNKGTKAPEEGSASQKLMSELGV